MHTVFGVRFLVNVTGKDGVPERCETKCLCKTIRHCYSFRAFSVSIAPFCMCSVQCVPELHFRPRSPIDKLKSELLFLPELTSQNLHSQSLVLTVAAAYGSSAGISGSLRRNVWLPSFRSFFVFEALKHP